MAIGTPFSVQKKTEGWRVAKSQHTVDKISEIRLVTLTFTSSEAARSWVTVGFVGCDHLLLSHCKPIVLSFKVARQVGLVISY